MNEDKIPDLGEIVNRNNSNHVPESIDNETRRTESNTEGLDNIANTAPEGTPSSKAVRVYNYLSNRQRLKAIGVLGGTIAGVAILKDKLPEITHYCENMLPFLSNEAVSLTIDTIANTVLAPIGFLLSGYAHNTKLNKKEFLGQVAFAAGWGVIRHYVYSGLRNFDEITLMNVSLKTGLYTVYYVAYGGLYATFSEYWSKVCSGIPHLEAIKGIGKNFGKKLKALSRDAEIQLNLALNIANMFNPLVESRPSVGGGLLIQYNMGVLKHADNEKKLGFLGYLKSIFSRDKDCQEIGSFRESTPSFAVPEIAVAYEDRATQPTFREKMGAFGDTICSYLAITGGLSLLTAMPYLVYDTQKGMNEGSPLGVAAYLAIMAFLPANFLISAGAHGLRNARHRIRGESREPPVADPFYLIRRLLPKNFGLLPINAPDGPEMQTSKPQKLPIGYTPFA